MAVSKIEVAVPFVALTITGAVVGAYYGLWAVKAASLAAPFGALASILWMKYRFTGRLLPH